MTAVQALQSPDPVNITPAVMLDRAIASGNVEVIERMAALYERWEQNQSRRAFEAALARAKAGIAKQTISKNRTVDFVGKTGIRTNYRHEDLHEIARVVDPILAEHGLAYRYRTTSLPNEPVTVTCIVFGHGHSEENTLSAGRDESGNKNSIQAVGSTVTFLERYTLKAALGLAVSNDDDGAASQSTVKIDVDQATTLTDMIEAAGGDAVKARLLKWAKVDAVEDIPANLYEQAIDNLKKVKR